MAKKISKLANRLARKLERKIVKRLEKVLNEEVVSEDQQMLDLEVVLQGLKNIRSFLDGPPEVIISLEHPEDGECLEEIIYEAEKIIKQANGLLLGEGYGKAEEELPKGNQACALVGCKGDHEVGQPCIRGADAAGRN